MYVAYILILFHFHFFHVEVIGNVLEVNGIGYEGGGWLSRISMDSFCLDECCSSSYEDSKMGSHTSQFYPVAVL